MEMVRCDTCSVLQSLEPHNFETPSTYCGLCLGCPDPDFCMPSIVGGPEGQECPAFCPVVCGEEEMICGGEYDPTGV